MAVANDSAGWLGAYEDKAILDAFILHLFHLFPFASPGEFIKPCDSNLLDWYSSL